GAIHRASSRSLPQRLVNVPGIALRLLREDRPDLIVKRPFLHRRCRTAGIREESPFRPVTDSADLQGDQAPAGGACEFSQNQKIAVGVLAGCMRVKIAEAPGIERLVSGNGSEAPATGK